MTAPSINYRRHVRRPVGFVVLGVLLLGVAGYLAYDVIKRQSSIEPVPEAYSYTVKQSVDKSVEYFPSSFYENGPGKNTAYIMGLTDKIAATFHYDFSASQQQQLSYAYDVRAVVRAKYSFKGDESDSTNVWSKEFQILAPVHGTVTTDKLMFTPRVEIPYDDYRKLVEQLRTALTLPIRSDVTVTLTVSVTGNVDGMPFNDLRMASISAPVEEQIYALSQKYDKEDTKQVVATAVQTSVDRDVQYEMYGSVALGVMSLMAFIYGFRKQIFKTPYQRELDKIYRYHDGIIVRATRQTDMSGKHIVQVKSFDDMLNLEEELKLPIVATALGAEATRFTIIRDDVVYAFILGQVRRKNETSLEQIEETLRHKLGDIRTKKRPPKVQ